MKSLSARRAWIEMDMCVDAATALSSRSPQGERGLKSGVLRIGRIMPMVALRKESVD